MCCTAGMSMVAKRRICAPAGNRNPVLQIVVTLLNELVSSTTPSFMTHTHGCTSSSFSGDAHSMQRAVLSG